MFCYIYKISEKLSEILKNKNFKSLNIGNNNLIFEKDGKVNSENSKYNFNGQTKLNGFVDLNFLDLYDKIPFEIRVDSRFLFIKTGHQVLKVEALEVIQDFFNKEMDAKLQNFVPSKDKEIQLICSISKDKSLKFFHNSELIDADKEIEDKYCKNEYLENHVFIEAYIELEKNLNFYYYRKSLRIPKEYNEEKVESIIQTFERVMA